VTVQTTSAGATAQLAVPSGAYTLSATYAGSSDYIASQTSQAIIVYLPTSFVIWGGNPGGVTAGGDYTFWGAQWAKQVTGGSYSAALGFEGYATNVNATGTWTASTGNSSTPPSAIASYISVLVATTITRNGHNITGNTASQVVLRVDDPTGYAPHPGHAASGTMISAVG